MQFDRFLFPDSATRQGVCVQAASPTGSSADCPGAVDLVPHYDPVDRAVAWTPRNGFSPQTHYSVRLIVPRDPADTSGIRAFDGVPLAANTQPFEFTTGDANSPPTLAEPTRDVDYCYKASDLCALPDTVCSTLSTTGSHTPGPDGILTQNGCSGANFNCHGQSAIAATALTGTALLLNLQEGGVPAAVQQLINQGQVATETATAADPKSIQRAPNSPFGQNMPYIDVKNPGNSYLLYKALLSMPGSCPSNPNDTPLGECPSANGLTSPGNYSSDYYNCDDLRAAGVMTPTDGGTCTSDAGLRSTPATAASTGELIPAPVDPWVPDTDWKPPVAGEYDRLRLRIRGQKMPPPGYSPLIRQSALTLSAWIETGANGVEACSQ